MPSVIHAPIVSIGACPGMMSVVEEFTGRRERSSIVRDLGTMRKDGLIESGLRSMIVAVINTRRATP